MFNHPPEFPSFGTRPCCQVEKDATSMRALDRASLGGWAGLISRENMRSPTNESKVSQGFQSPKKGGRFTENQKRPRSRRAVESPLGWSEKWWSTMAFLASHSIGSPGNWGFPQPWRASQRLPWQVAAMYFGSYGKSGHCASAPVALVAAPDGDLWT